MHRILAYPEEKFYDYSSFEELKEGWLQLLLTHDNEDLRFVEDCDLQSFAMIDGELVTDD